MAARSRKKCIVFLANLAANAIHRVGDLIVGMACDVFVQRRRIHLTPGALVSLCQSLGALENVVRNGYSRFHTNSITGDVENKNVGIALGVQI